MTFHGVGMDFVLEPHIVLQEAVDDNKEVDQFKGAFLWDNPDQDQCSIDLLDHGLSKELLNLL